MSENSDKSQMHASSAPSPPDDFQMGLPPPSYDECLKMNNTSRSDLHQYTYSNPTPHQQQQVFRPPPSYAGPGPSLMPYGYANPYQNHIQQQQFFYNTLQTSPGPKNSENVLYLAKGAQVRTTASGAISIPPPPPGCAPTAGQIAAMSGQPVMIKKKKNSFF